MPTAQEVFESTTATIVRAIEEGAGSWSMPWSRDGVAFPVNPTTHKHYRGGNVLALMASALIAGWECGQWATYKQWASIGAQVRKGERGTGCIFWNVTQDTMTAEDEQTGEPIELVSHPRFRTRAFVVFNAAQVDEYEPAPPVRNTEAQIGAAEAFFARVEARVEHRNEGCAYYQPAADLIVLPPFEAFTDAHAYYATSAHEHAYWTGHPTRLDRNLGSRFGDHAYAAEELVAELSAAFTCAALGISTTPRPDHAAYLASWLQVLREDPRALFTVATKAQAATDQLCTLAGEPSGELMAAATRAAGTVACSSARRSAPATSA